MTTPYLRLPGGSTLHHEDELHRRHTRCGLPKVYAGRPPRHNLIRVDDPPDHLPRCRRCFPEHTPCPLCGGHGRIPTNVSLPRR